MTKPLTIIGVIGGGSCSTAEAALASRVGELIAGRGAALVCGGLGGVMEAAARGAAGNGGLTIGIMPGSRREEANPGIAIPIVTDLGHARNALIVHTAQALIAVAGEYGTLSEIAIALKLGKTVVTLGGWTDIRGVIAASSPEEAVEKAFNALV
ncbi:MAG: TIGR00725 family protein [Nitrospinae bacterium]|nr:TIGR00725 family protein [Nitrospinota bacterium]